MDTPTTPEPTPRGYSSVDYHWFDTRFEVLQTQLTALKQTLTTIQQTVAVEESAQTPPVDRAYYSVPEFAAQVERGEYTVREWCRLGRIHAEKCETGRGDAKSWKIPAEELPRYRDHGLLPTPYLR